jgi:hypothetical protein
LIAFDDQGHLLWTPSEVYQLAIESPSYLINDLLMSATPAAFPTRRSHFDFLEAVRERTGVHPRNLFLRGSCQVGFSIAPKAKVWTLMSDESDLDLAIVDAEYFSRINHDVQRWADDNRAETLQEGVFHFDYVGWEQDRRRYNCCRAGDLPLSVCVHHQQTMEAIADRRDCGRHRELNAFIYRDWWSVFRRYEWDLIDLVRRIRRRELTAPADEPLPPEGARASARVGPPGSQAGPTASLPPESA